MNNDMLNLLIKFRLLGLKQYLHVNIGGIGIVLQVILLIFFFVMVIFVPSEMATLLFVFPIINCIIVLIVKYYGQNIEKEFEFFEDNLEFSITEKVTYKLFNKMIEDLDEKKYHICRELDENGYIKAWSIFRQNMPIEKYFSEENKPILTSTNNDISDLLIFLEEQKNAKRNKKINGKRI